MTCPLKLCFDKPNIEQGCFLGWSEVLHPKYVPRLSYDSFLERDHNHKQVSRALVNNIDTSFSLVETYFSIYHSILFVVLKFFTEAKIREIYCTSFFSKTQNSYQRKCLGYWLFVLGKCILPFLHFPNTVHG